MLPHRLAQKCNFVILRITRIKLCAVSLITFSQAQLKKSVAQSLQDYHV